jgi:hypothetical protein
MSGDSSDEDDDIDNDNFEDVREQEKLVGAEGLLLRHIQQDIQRSRKSSGHEDDSFAQHAHAYADAYADDADPGITISCSSSPTILKMQQMLLQRRHLQATFPFISLVQTSGPRVSGASSGSSKLGVLSRLLLEACIWVVKFALSMAGTFAATYVPGSIVISNDAQYSWLVWSMAYTWTVFVCAPLLTAACNP